MPSLRTLATGLAASRVAFGAGMVVVPSLPARTWVGSSARRPAVRTLARALGARDLAIGAAALVSLRRGDARHVRERFVAQVGTDTVDLLATLAAGRALPGPARAFTVAVAAASVAIAAATAARAEEVAGATA